MRVRGTYEKSPEWTTQANFVASLQTFVQIGINGEITHPAVPIAKVPGASQYTGADVSLARRDDLMVRNEQLPDPSKHSGMCLEPVFLSEPDSPRRAASLFPRVRSEGIQGCEVM